MSGEDAFRDLLGYLQLQPDGADHFAATTRPMRSGRLFGGLIAAQALVAAGHTVHDMTLHSLHAYFLRPGTAGRDVEYIVERIKEGKNFKVRDISAMQDGQHIFSMQCSYTRLETGISHQEPMRQTPSFSPDMEPRDEADHPMNPDACELRCIDGHPRRDPGPPSLRYWCRLNGEAPGDSGLKAALLVYLSDRCLLSTGRRPHVPTIDLDRGDRLDHAAWLHREPNFDDWLMYETDSPVAQAGPPRITGKLYQSDGTLIATLVQEGLIRPRRPR